MSKHAAITIMLLVSFSAKSQWINTGPNGGYTTQLIKHNNKIFVGSYAGRIFNTSDNGQNWQACNPIVTGTQYTARVLASAGGVLYALLDHKGVYQSSNDGANWQLVGNQVDSMGAGYGIAVLADTMIIAGATDVGEEIVFCSIRQGGNWSNFRNVTNGFTPNYNTPQLAALNGQMYLSVAQGFYVFSASTNSWVTATLPVAGSPYFLNNSSGSYLALTSSGYFYSTDGNSWNAITSILNDPYSLAISGNTILAASAGPYYPGVSLNGGSTWNSVPLPYAGYFAFNVIQAGSDFLLSTSGGGVYKFVTATTSFQKSDNGLFATPVTNVVKTSAGHIFTVSQYSYISESSDNFNTWQYAPFGVSTSVSSVFYNHEFLLFGFNSPGILASIDNGDTLYNMVGGSARFMYYDFAQRGTDTVYACNNNTLLKSTNNGLTFDSVGSFLLNRLSSGTSRLYATDYTGIYCKIQDGVLRSYPNPGLGFIYDIATSGDDLLIGAEHGLYILQNDTILTIASSLTGNAPVYAVSYIDNKVYAGTENQVIVLDRFLNFIETIPVATNFRSRIVKIDSNICITNNLGVWKQDSPAALRPLDSENTSLSVYPNPAGEQINLSFTTDGEEVSITVYDVNGRILSRRSAQTSSGTNRVQLNTGNLAAGVYLCQIVGAGGSAVKHFIIR